MKTQLPPPPRDYQKSHQMMGAWLHKHHLSCEHYTHLALVAYDRPLGLRERIQRRLHFLICSVCRKFSKQIKVLRHLVKLHGKELAETKPREEFLQNLREQLATTDLKNPNNSNDHPHG